MPGQSRCSRHEYATYDQLGELANRPNQTWFLLILLSVAQFMVIIDATVVNVALPSIGQELGFATAADLQWVVTAYVLVTGGLTLLGGRVTDLLNRRRLFLIGLVVFTAASLTTGLSPSPGLLIASRAARGLGAALLTPAALAIVTTPEHAVHALRTRLQHLLDSVSMSQPPTFWQQLGHKVLGSLQDHRAMCS